MTSTVIDELVTKVDEFKTIKETATADMRDALVTVNELTEPLRVACNTTEVKKSDINWVNTATTNDIEKAIDQTIKRLVLLSVVLNATNYKDTTNLAEDLADVDSFFNVVTRDRLQRQLDALAHLGKIMERADINNAYDAVQQVMTDLRTISESKEQMIAEIQAIDADIAGTPTSMYIPLASYASEENPNRKHNKKDKLITVASKHDNAAKQLTEFVKTV